MLHLPGDSRFVSHGWLKLILTFCVLSVLTSKHVTLNHIIFPSLLVPEIILIPYPINHSLGSSLMSLPDPPFHEPPQPLDLAWILVWLHLPEPQATSRTLVGPVLSTHQHKAPPIPHPSTTSSQISPYTPGLNQDTFYKPASLLPPPGLLPSK